MKKILNVADLPRGSALLKQLVKASDVNEDEAVRWKEARWGVDPKKGIGITVKHPNAKQKALPPSFAIEAVMRFSQLHHSSEVTQICKSVDTLAKRVKAAAHDGFIYDTDLSKLRVAGEYAVATFAGAYGHNKLSDFNLPAKHQTKPSRFSWKGTPTEVCTSLLNAFSERKNDNFWPNAGPSRYVIGPAEAKKMVKALKLMSQARQRVVIGALSARTLKSEFGCAAVNAQARPVFAQYVKSLGLPVLPFNSPIAPKYPVD